MARYSVATGPVPLTIERFHGGTPLKRLFIALFFILPLFVNGCIYDASNQVEADQLVSQYHDALKANDLDAVLALYGPEFFKDHSSTGWRHTLAALHERYGSLKQARQAFTQKDHRYRGDYYIYGYTLVFEKGTISEVITVFKGIENDKLTIAGHVFKARAAG